MRSTTVAIQKFKLVKHTQSLQYFEISSHDFLRTFGKILITLNIFLHMERYSLGKKYKFLKIKI